jgi:cyclic pyranopterin phosphate synthase
LNWVGKRINTGPFDPYFWALALYRKNDYTRAGLPMLPVTHGDRYTRLSIFLYTLIELMPMGDTARSKGYVDLQPIRARLQERFGLVDTVMPGGGPARYLGSADGTFNVGFITPISQHFCATCNRVRLTVDGQLHLCLGQEERMDFRALLRGGAGDDELAAALDRAIELKPERHEFREQPGKLIRFMSMTGG